MIKKYAISFIDLLLTGTNFQFGHPVRQFKQKGRPKGRPFRNELDPVD